MTKDELLKRYANGERDFRGANLKGAILTGANLAGANLKGADLGWAYLRGANLKEANLCAADLSGANLSMADLEGANLDGTRLRAADLSGANLKGANLGGAILAGVNLRGADLKGTKLPPALTIPDLDRQILAAVSSVDAGLDMDKWHTCQTTHCLAGWAIHLAGKAGYALEAAVGPEVAGTLIYHASTGSVPNFFATDEKALADLKSRAGRSK